MKPKIRYFCFYCQKESEDSMRVFNIQLIPGSAGILRYVCDDCIKKEIEQVSES